ncbi:hypothetical protein Tco_0294642 [Tanacetum coccineum]
MVACLERTEGNANFHQIVDFMNDSTIKYSLTISPTIYASYINQFWATVKSKIVNNEMQIHAKVDGKTIVISESSVRSNLHFNDEDGVTSLTNSKILENLALMGYEIVFDKLTFQKAFFSPQWKYLIHTILHCLSSKSTAWNEFSTNIASAVICLANNQKFNFSKLIFDGMLRNLDPNSKKFLMYPRFLQLFLNNQVKNLAEPFNDTYETPKHTQKVFANMRRKGKGFSGTVTPLFQSMLVPQVVEGEGSGQPSEPQPPSLTAPPSYEVQVTTIESHPQKTHTPRRAKIGRETEIPQSSGPPKKVGDEVVYTGEDDRVGTGSDSGPKYQDTTLGDADAQTRVLALKTSKTAQDLVINMLKKKVKRLEKKQRARPREETSDWYLHRKKGYFDDDIDDMVNEVMDIVEGDTVNAGGAVNTATIGVSAASASVTTAGLSISIAELRTPPITTTTAFKDEILTKLKHLSLEKPPKDPRKAQIQLIEELAMRLFEEEQAQFEREQRIARERATEQEAKDAALIEQMEDIQARMDADELLAERLQQEEREQFTIKKKLYEREKKWINDFVPMDSKVVKDSRKGKAEGSRKKIVARKRTGEKLNNESVKRQKIEDDAEKEELRAYFDIILGDDEAVNVESLATKYPIVDWKTHVLSEDKMYYEVIRGDGSTKFYKIFTKMLDDFDRQDVLDLYRLVKERFETKSPEGYDILLWGDLITVFEPSEDDEIWKAQQDYTLIS